MQVFGLRLSLLRPAVLAATRSQSSSARDGIKLVTYSSKLSKTGRLALGVLLNKDESILPLKQIPSLSKKEIGSMVSFISLAGLDGVDRIKAYIKGHSALLSPDLLVKTKKSHIHAPIPVPARNVFCVGKNYSDHIAEVAKAAKSLPGGGGSPVSADVPSVPVFFTKAASAIVGPDKPIESHAKLTKWLDWEAELAVVIGKGGRDISAKEAMSHVFGYTIANDVTARDLQKRHVQWFKGKTLDGTLPLGPALVPACCLDPSDLAISLSVNGVQKQDSRTSKMIHKIPQIIASLSEGFTLQPGDVILTGTPDGVGFARSPPEVLTPGDVVEVDIEGLGKLRNPVV